MNYSIKVILLNFVISLFSCSGGQNSKVKINTLTQKEKKEGRELLFDGMTLNNCKMFNGGEVTGWKIANGVPENSGMALAMM